MATASLQAASLGQQGKLTKSRTRKTVRPILKKLHTSSYSEKNSLDLDRAWEDQQSPRLGYTDQLYNNDAQSFNHFDPPANARSVRDVSFSLSAADLLKRGADPSVVAYSSADSTSSATPASIAIAHKPSHARSTSGTSHISLATTTSGRNGSFVHPFQQTPRTSTPPLLSYANSLASFDIIQRDSSSPTTITEDEDTIDPTAPGRSLGQYQQMKSPLSHQNSAVPSTAESSGSFSDAAQPLRVASGWTSTSSGSRSMQATSSLNHPRLSDGQIVGRSSVTIVDPPPLSTTATLSEMATATMTPVSTNTMSPLRSSLDMSNFRIRSRSDVDTSTRQEQVRAARRKFDEKEKAKEEKYVREQTRKRERADTKEAHRIEKAHSRHGSYSGRTSSSIDIRPAFSRKNTGNSTTRFDTTSETATADFVSRGYKEMSSGQSPRARTEEVHFESSRRPAKRKANGTWTSFVLWLRTRLLKLGRR